MNIFTNITLLITLNVLTAKVVIAQADTQVFYVTLEDHVFTPQEIKVPANKKVKLIVHNKDTSAEEFDSFDLNRERVIFAGKKATIYIGPLLPGKYEYFGEFHPNSARGFVIAQESKNDR